MTINTNAPFKLGNWYIYPQLNKVRLPLQKTSQHLSPKLMQILLLLVEKGHEPVDIDTIMASVWQHKVVSDSSVYQAIAQLRKVLNTDPQHQQYIERVSAKGYRIADTINVSEFNTSSKNTIRYKSTLLLVGLAIFIGLVAVILPSHDEEDEHFESLTLAHYLQGMHDPEQINQAQKLYQQILQADSNNVKALVGLCNTYRKLSFYADLPEIKRDNMCQPLLQKAFELEPKEPKVLASLGKQATEQGDNEAATAFFEKALAIDPETPQIWRWYGKLLRKQNNIQEALKAHQKAFQLAPNDPLVLRALAYTYLNNRDIPKAQKYYRRSNIITPNFTHRPLYDLDFYPLTQQRAQAYIEWHKRYYDSHIEKYPYYQYSHGLLLLSLDQLELAKETLANIIPSDRPDGFELYVKASIAWYQKNDKKALSLLKQRYQLATRQNLYVMPYIMALFHCNHSELALELFTKHFADIVNSTLPLQAETLPQYLLLASLLKANNQDYENIYYKLEQYHQKHKQFELNSEIKWQALNGKSQIVNQLLVTKINQGWLPDYNDNIFSLRHYQKIAGNNAWSQQLSQLQSCVWSGQSKSCFPSNQTHVDNNP